MNKDKALERLAALETEAAELRKIIEAPKAPEPIPSLLTNPWPEGVLLYLDLQKSALGLIYKSRSSMFQSEELADAYAEAIETMLLLRHQPGTVAATTGYQWVLHPDEYLTGIHPVAWMARRLKMGCISPCFATDCDARDAIDAIGEERIIRMFKTFHHIQ